MTKDDFLAVCKINYGESVVKMIEAKPAFVEFLDKRGFLTAPASTRFHGAYEGGLIEHSFNVSNRLHWLTKNLGLKWERPESPFIIGMFHDICKFDQYIPVTEDGKTTYKFNTDTKMKGHGEKSVNILSYFFDLTEEEKLCIRFHMGPYEKDDWAEFDKAIRQYQNVYWTHAADMVASKVDEN